MVDAWLIVVTVLTAAVMLALTVYVFYLYCHPDDNTFVMGWVAKVVVIAALAIVWGFILLLPLDVANSRGVGGGLNMDLAYQLMFILTFCFVGFVLPYTLFLYETDDEKPFIGRVLVALCYEAGIAFAILCFALIAWGGLRKAQVADLLHADLSQVVLSEAAGGAGAALVIKNGIAYNLPPYLFMCVFVIFVGWFFFVLFGGIGIIALPFDLIMGYVYRPKPRPALEMAEKKVALRRRCEELLAFTKGVEGMALDGEEAAGAFSKWRAGRQIKTKEGKLQKELYLLEQEMEIYELESQLKANPLTDALKLALGVFLAFISFVIILHVLLYNLIVVNGRPANLFLNSFLFWLEFSIARFVSTIFFAAFGVYLVFCVVKGAVRFGLRVFFLIKIHPMKLNNTYMNSFLFNAIMIMLASLGSIHFTVILFANYMRLTSGSIVFGTLLTKLRVLKFFWQYKVFLYVFLFFAAVTSGWLMWKPKADKLDVRAMITKRKKR